MNKRVLVVDDEPSLRVLLCDNLEMEDYQPISAGTGNQALELAFSQDPAAIVTDIGLPDMSGWEVCQKLRADPKTAGIFQIVLSGSTGPEIKALAEKYRIDHYVTKPYDPQTIVDLLNKTLKVKDNP